MIEYNKNRKILKEFGCKNNNRHVLLHIATGKQNNITISSLGFRNIRS